MTKKEYFYMFLFIWCVTQWIQNLMLWAFAV